MGRTGDGREPGTGLAGELLALAESMAREAGALAAARRLQGVDIADTKTSSTDIVTEADRASEELIRARIHEARPDDAILGEEGGDAGGSSGVRWVVDPIDGTVNYAHGLGQYAVSIGVELDGEAVAGVVHNPDSGVTYTATAGGGAFRDGKPLRVADAVPLERSLIGTGFSYDRELRAAQARSVADLLPRVADIRRFGSCALDLCAVAAGALDGYVEEGIGGPWDWVAGALIAAEAGARCEVLTGASGKTLVIAAPAASYEDFRALVTACGFVTEQG